MKMKINPADFQAPLDEGFKLSERATKVKPFFKSKKHYHKQLDKGTEELGELQRLHYASIAMRSFSSSRRWTRLARMGPFGT